MHVPKISIIIHLTAEEHFANLCFESLLKQTFNDFECLCVISEIEKEYPFLQNLTKKDKRFKILKQIDSPSKWHCYNEALYQMKGEYALFLNASDLLHPQALDIYTDSLRYSHAHIATANPAYFSGMKKIKALDKKITFEKSSLKRKNNHLLSEFWQENLSYLNETLEGKMFSAELLAYLKFHPSLSEFAAYFFMEQFYSVAQNSVYVRYPLYFFRKEAHIPSVASYETLMNLKERILFEYAYFVEGGRTNAYTESLLSHKCSQDLFLAIKHILMHTPERSFMCINQQIITLIDEFKEYGLLKGLNLSLVQKGILLALTKGNPTLAKKLIHFFY